MAKARKTLKHARSIRSIHAVTGSMEKVATVRFKRAHEHVASARPYIRRLAELVGDLVHRSNGEQLAHPLLAEPDSGCKADVLLAITSHRGLCGAYNDALARIAAERAGQLSEAGYEVLVHAVGKRGTRQLRAKGLRIDRHYADLPHPPEYPAIAALADELAGQFLAGKISGLEVAYMQFVSSGVQKPAVALILPLSQLAPPSRFRPVGREPIPYEIIPSTRQLLDRLLPQMLRLKLYQCFTDAAAAEEIMRMRAMRLASDNAEEMIHKLTVRYNRQRQSQITTELAEIVGGREGVK